MAIPGTGRNHRHRPREGSGDYGNLRRAWLDASHRAERRYGKALIRAALDGTDAPDVKPARVAADWWNYT